MIDGVKDLVYAYVRGVLLSYLKPLSSCDIDDLVPRFRLQLVATINVSLHRWRCVNLSNMNFSCGLLLHTKRLLTTEMFGTSVREMATSCRLGNCVAEKVTTEMLGAVVTETGSLFFCPARCLL